MLNISHTLLKIKWVLVTLIKREVFEASASRINESLRKQRQKYFRDLLEEKQVLVKGRDTKISELEREIADLLAKNNILLSEKEHNREHEQVTKITLQIQF